MAVKVAGTWQMAFALALGNGHLVHGYEDVELKGGVL